MVQKRQYTNHAQPIHIPCIGFGGTGTGRGGAILGVRRWRGQPHARFGHSAGAGAVYFTKQNLDTAKFVDAIRLIQNDDDAYCYGSARASIVQDRDGTHYCAIAMTKYQPPEQAAE